MSVLFSDQLDDAADAILIDVLALKGRDLVQSQAVAIPRTTGVDVLLFTAVGCREIERFFVGVARIQCSGIE